MPQMFGFFRRSKWLYCIVGGRPGSSSFRFRRLLAHTVTLSICAMVFKPSQAILFFFFFLHLFNINFQERVTGPIEKHMRGQCEYSAGKDAAQQVKMLTAEVIS